MIETPDSLSKEEIYQKTKKDLEQYGWTILSTIYQDVIFAHTLGLMPNFSHPEVEVIGLTDDLTRLFLNSIAQRVKLGEVYNPGSVISELVEGFDLMMVTNPLNPQGPPSTNGRLRLIWPDSNHRYPWEEGCEANCLTQQLLPDSTSGGN